MYKVGSFIFDIKCQNICIPENMNKFIIEEAHTCHYTYNIQVVDNIEIKESQFFINRSNIKIVINNQLEKRYLYIMGDSTPYAVCEEIDEQSMSIFIHKDYLDYFKVDTMFVSLLSLERRLYQYHEFILHSSYIVYKNQAILFTAPSGTGKSTQASLWEKYRGARIINGDRSLIVNKNGKYYATGLPICGSSKICFNEEYPIKAVVILDQGKENSIETLSYKEMVKKLFSEITVNYHNNEFVDNVLDFIDDFIVNVPVYHLTCNISEDAVICLDNCILNEQIN